MLLTLIGSILLAFAIVMQKTIIKKNMSIKDILTNKRWLFTILFDILGFGFYYVDLMRESITVIQPIFATVIIWALIIEAIVTKKKMSLFDTSVCVLAFIGMLFMGIA